MVYLLFLVPIAILYLGCFLGFKALLHLRISVWAAVPTALLIFFGTVISIYGSLAFAVYQVYFHG